MNRYLTIVLALVCLVGVAHPQTDEESSCVGCHLEQDPPYSTPAEQFGADIHAQAGFGCDACHGGDPGAWDYDQAKDPASGFVGVPAGRKVIEVCSRCHENPALMRRYNPNLPTDQEAKYWTSGHGKSLKRGNQEAAQCASCHGTHAIKRSSDPASSVYHTNVAATCGSCHSNPRLMEKYHLDAHIVDQYKRSVHGVALLERGDVAAPACNNCHGNHGAAPPEVGSIQEVCGTCHVNNQSLFNNTSMKEIFAMQGLHGCVVCHTAHDIQRFDYRLVSLGSDGVCGQCHEPDDPGGLETGLIYGLLDSLNTALGEARNSLNDAETRGLEIEELLLDMQTATSAMIHSRTMVHTFNTDRIHSEAEPGFELVAKIVHEVERLRRDFLMRRIGLGIATLFMSLMAVGLYLYIRSLDSREKPPARPLSEQ